MASLMQEFHKRLQQIVHQRTHRLRLTASQTKKEGKENPHKCLAVGRVSEGKDINRTHTHTLLTHKEESPHLNTSGRWSYSMCVPHTTSFHRVAASALETERGG